MYPALAVLQRLENKVEAVLWVGGQGGMEETLVRRAGVPFRAVPAAGVHGVGLRALPGNLWRLTQGYFAARRVLADFRPDVLFFTGGYVAVPVGLAGRRIPTLLYVPDIEPGLALKTLARLADRIAVTAEDSRAFFAPKAPVVVTGYPVRRDLLAWDRARGREALGLPAEAQVLLVFGGSKGARSINRALLASLPRLLEAGLHIVHITGQLDWPEVSQAREALAAEQATRYRVYPYLHEEMGAALAAADLVVSRAGASTLGEFPAFGLPAVLVPYPYAWRYQQVNAEYLARQGAALIVPDADLRERLAETVLGLFTAPERLEAMRQAMRRLAQPQAAERIAEQLLALGQKE